MELQEEPDGSLLLTHDSTAWTKRLIGPAILLLVTAGYAYFSGARDDRVIGLLAGSATLAVVALALLEQSRFRVDLSSRLIEWDQRWGFRRRAGLTPFSDVKHVSVDVPVGDRGIPSRRVVLHLSSGELLPLTVGYKTDADDAIARLANTLRLKLGHRQPTMEDSVRILVERGRAVEAVKLLVETEAVSLTEARARVDRIRGR